MKQVLDFIKANAVALSWGVVSLIAVIALFVWPVPGMFAELHGKVDARKQTFTNIETLSKATRTLPNFDTASIEAPPLKEFPTKDVIAAGQKAVERVKDGAKSILAAAVASNARTPLVPDALPAPQSLARNNFFNAYRIETAQYGDDADRGIIRRVLHGTLPPTADELAAIDNSRTNEIKRLNLQVDARGVAQNQAQVDALIAKMKAELPLQQLVMRAEKFQAYVSPGAVEVHPSMGSISDLNAVNAVTIFNAQFSLWIQTTVLEAIANANRGSTNILDSPIKHLVALRVPMNIADQSAMSSVMGGGPPSEAAAAAPVDLKPDAAATIATNYSTDPLGYVSNPMYDSIHVDLVLRLDATRLPEALAALGRDQLVKIRNVSFRTVDLGTALAEGYLYSRDGSTPVVEVTMSCDVLVLREWLVHYMPDPVKAVFNSFANPAAVPQ